MKTPVPERACWRRSTVVFRRIGSLRTSPLDETSRHAARVESERGEYLFVRRGEVYVCQLGGMAAARLRLYSRWTGERFCRCVREISTT